MSATADRASPFTSGGPLGQQSQRNVYDFPKAPLPLYRHAAPSAPWPWMNFNIDPSKVRPVTPGLPDESEWGKYPQRPFENWTYDQVNRSQMLTKCSEGESSTIYKVSIFDDGEFAKQVKARTVRKDDHMDLRAYWNHLAIPPPSNIRIQALFVDDMTLPVLQMLGTKYNVEPFFFASSANWIPSRYQEDPRELEDHITVVLPFIRTFKNQRRITRADLMKILTFGSAGPQSPKMVDVPLPYAEEKQIIDTQAPLPLPGNKILFQDLLSLHMVRNTGTSTIISYHSSMQIQGTSANRLQSLVQRTGDSAHWSKIFKRSRDPTFHLLAVLWYALYAWDEAFEVLARYIHHLEYDVLQSYNIKLTRELHKLQAHLLYYQQLLREFHRSVEFVRDTPNPAMNAPSVSKGEREESARLLRTEAQNLITEIKRLTQQREMLSARLDNVIHLAFATVSIEESKATQKLAIVTMMDSAAIKQIAYLSMVFLPATYLANVFSMNVNEINPGTKGTLTQYIVVTIGLTAFTAWLVTVCQKESLFYPRDSDIFHRALWPFFYTYDAVSTRVKGFLMRRVDMRSLDWWGSYVPMVTTYGDHAVVTVEGLYVIE